jgi:hypothetical protein
LVVRMVERGGDRRTHPGKPPVGGFYETGFLRLW